MLGPALIVVALAGSAPAPVDQRSVELLRESCASGIATREVVLFGNGTVRLREGPLGELRMLLGELGVPELAAFRRRLAEVHVSTAEVVAFGPQGEWLDRCHLRLALEPETVHELDYVRFDSTSLELEKLRRVIEDLVIVARGDGSSAEFPVSYTPRRGDRLERADGAVFEVMGFTSDGRGVELASDDPPLTVFIDRDELQTMFRRVLHRQGEP